MRALAILGVMRQATSSPSSRRPLSLLSKFVLFVRIWFWFLAVHVRLRIDPLPVAVLRLRPRGPSRPPAVAPGRLGSIIARVLTVGGHEPRCLIKALVHYRLLTEQGEPALLVIGIPPSAPDHQAHAWIEINGIDVGPPPGGAGHLALARYPVSD